MIGAGGVPCVDLKPIIRCGALTIYLPPVVARGAYFQRRDVFLPLNIFQDVLTSDFGGVQSTVYKALRW